MEVAEKIVFATCYWRANDESFAFSRCYNFEWVKRLYDGFKRHTTRPFDFLVFVDEYNEHVDGIQQVLLEKRPIGYHSFIEPFRLNRPMILVGLDTIITGNVDYLVDYCMTATDIALPIDPFFPDRACNGVALVPAGNRHIHDNHNGENDMEWMRANKHVYIDEVFPRYVQSYKGSVRDNGLGDSRIVYFHGKEKPHEIDVDWVKREWGEPPMNLITEFTNGLNNDRAAMVAQFAANIKRNVPFFEGHAAHERAALIIGGGPSLADTLPNLILTRSDGDIFALNGTHDYLIERGITPEYMVMLDSRQDNVGFVRNPSPYVKYHISAFCHPDVFDALEGYDVTLWMSDMDGVRPLVAPIKNKPVCLIGGGATVAMKTMFMCYLMGYRKFHFYGLDSSYREEQNHAYIQPMNDSESRIDIHAAGRKFICSPWMAKQAKEFQEQVRMLADLDCDMYVHGDGLIPWIMKQWQIQVAIQENANGTG